MAVRDLFVIGASAGGVSALSRLAASLPPDFPGAVFVVLHVPPYAPSALPEILSRAGPLPAIHPRDGQAIEMGTIYVAPPDHHLLVRSHDVGVTRGPTENRHRPSIDSLFRSAARAHGPRVVGVILTGTLDDGTAGLVAVKVRGGLAVVQDPEEASSPGMPRTALRYVEADHVVPLAEIGPLLARLARKGVGESPPAPADMVKETETVELDMDTLEDDDKPGTPSAFTCPDCNGTLWELQERHLLRFRCRVGHSYTSDSMDAAQAESVERALWAGLRALEERSALVRRMAAHAREHNFEGFGVPYEERLRQIEEDAELLRNVLLKRGRRPMAETTRTLAGQEAPRGV